MKTKQLEQLLIALAGLLIIGFVIIQFSGSSASTQQIMSYGLSAGVAIYIGYSYIIQGRDRRQIDTMEENIDELKHKVADREHQIRDQKATIDSLNQQNVQLSSDLENERTKYAEAENSWKAQVQKLESELAEATKE